MDASELKSRLTHAADLNQCVDEVGRYFSAHDLFYGHGTETAADEATL